MHIKTRHFIKGSEIKALKADILKHYDQDFITSVLPTKCRIEVIHSEAGDILYAVNNILSFWKSKDGYLPVLTLLLNNQVKLKIITVDMGAIRFVTNGADIMRPGITKIDPNIKENEIVQIVDETHGRALAVGKAMFDAPEMDSIKKGKVVRNLHTIKDSVWNFAKEFK